MNEDTQNNSCDLVEKPRPWYDGYFAASDLDPNKKKQLRLRIEEQQKRVGHPPPSKATECGPSADVGTARISRDLKSCVEGRRQEHILDLNPSSPAGAAFSSNAILDSTVPGFFDVEETECKKRRRHQQVVTDKDVKRVKSEDSLRTSTALSDTASQYLTIGRRVYCFWPETRGCYPGTVDAIHWKKNPIKCNIRFNDGIMRCSVKRSDIFLTRQDVFAAGLPAA